jgi:radical SAM protein with 4Fe4S-binding SPASM domain
MLPRQTTEADLPRIIALAQRAADAAPVAKPPALSAKELKEERREAQRQARVDVQASASPMKTSVSAPYGAGSLSGAKAPAGGRWSRLFRDDRQIYCHKPWTDMANFTVDGRVDVCCIATGASQERFALGNLNKQSFQEVWNGPMAREFRRTVNDPKLALPPCRRCPMAKAYAGVLLNPEATLFSAWARFNKAPLNRFRFGRYALFAVFLACYMPLHVWLFRGYDKPPLKASIAKIRGGRSM